MKLARLIACAALVAVAAAVPAQAAPIIGIGEQSPKVFTDPLFTGLRLHHVRAVVSWDGLHRRWERNQLDTYMAAARAAHVKVLLGFARARSRARKWMLPSVKRFAHEFGLFRARYPWVHEYLTWNEANICGQPTCHKPELAARYYNAIRKRCRKCTIVAADVLDARSMPAWIKRFRRVAKGRKIIWGIHNYIDANRFYTRGTRSLLRTVRGKVWFTETGGLVVRRNHSKIVFPGSIKHAAQATRFIFRLAALSHRVKRIYFYHWFPATAKRARWDSALVNRNDTPRPAYKVLRAWIRHHHAS